MERVRNIAVDVGHWTVRALIEPGSFKTPAIGAGGILLSLNLVADAARWAAAVGTAIIVLCHLYFYLAWIGCPLRRKVVKDCSSCRLNGSVLCPRKLPREEL